MIWKEIYDSLMDEPERWRQFEHTTDRDDGLSIWSGSGASFIHLRSPQKIGCPFFLRWKIDKAISTRHKRITINDIVKKNTNHGEVK